MIATETHLFSRLAGEWMDTRAVQKRSKKTDQALLRTHLLPSFGDTPLDQITSGDIERFKARSSKLRPASVNRTLNLLRAMLNHACRIGWLERTPMITMLREPQRQTFRYLKTDDEVRRFLEAARALPQPRGYAPEFVYSLYATATFTGLRLGELCALRREMIDFRQRIITVSESHEGPTKSGKIRYVPILEAVYSILETHVARVATPHVFPSASGTRLDRTARVFKARLAAVLSKAKLPKRYITFHGLRHTFASHWVMKGGDVFKLQKILGHSSIEVTMMYAHLAPHAFDGDLDRFNTFREPRLSLVLGGAE
jgi:integrase